MPLALSPVQSVLASKIILLIAGIETMCDLTVEARTALNAASTSTGSKELADLNLTFNRLRTHHVVMDRAYQHAIAAFTDVEERLGTLSAEYTPPTGHPRLLHSRGGMWHNFTDLMSERMSAIGERNALHAEMRKRLAPALADIDSMTPHRPALRMYPLWHVSQCSGSFTEDRWVSDDDFRARRLPFCHVLN